MTGRPPADEQARCFQPDGRTHATCTWPDVVVQRGLCWSRGACEHCGAHRAGRLGTCSVCGRGRLRPICALPGVPLAAGDVLGRAADPG